MKIVQLSEIAEVKLGRQRSPKNHVGDSMRAYLRAANVGWSGLRLDDVKEMNFTDSEMETFRLQPGDLLLNEASGSPSEVGKPALWDGELEDCAFQNTLLRVRPFPGWDSRFLLHYFSWQAVTGAFARGSRGVGIRHLGRDALAHWPVPVAELEEQRRIVQILDGADALRGKRGELSAKLEDLAQATFLKALNDADEARLLGDVLSLKSGAFLPAKNQVAGPYPVYGGNGVNGYHDVYMFTEPKIVIGRVGAYCGAVHLTSACSWITDNALYVNSSKVEFVEEFLAAALSNLDLNQYASQSGQPLISAGRLASVEIPVAPLNVQQAFGAQIRSIRAQQAALERAAQVGNALFGSLQHRAFSGTL